jgi:hypothetical protein
MDKNIFSWKTVTLRLESSHYSNSHISIHTHMCQSKTIRLLLLAVFSGISVAGSSFDHAPLFGLHTYQHGHLNTVALTEKHAAHQCGGGQINVPISWQAPSKTVYISNEPLARQRSMERQRSIQTAWLQ